MHIFIFTLYENFIKRGKIHNYGILMMHVGVIYFANFKAFFYYFEKLFLTFFFKSPATKYDNFNTKFGII